MRLKIGDEVILKKDLLVLRNLVRPLKEGESGRVVRIQATGKRVMLDRFPGFWISTSVLDQPARPDMFEALKH